MANAVAIKQESNTVRKTLEQMKPQLEMALPKHLTPERLIRVAMTAVQNTPKLLECDRTSLLSSIMTCAQLGLEPDGVLGQAYLIPFKTRGQMRVQFIPGYKGLITLARNSGDVTSIQAQAVHENDHFVFEFGLNERLEHRPAQGERGDVVYFYAIAKFKDGGYHWDVMTRSQVEKIRDESQGYKAAVASAKKYNKPVNSPWVDHFEEMGKKTVIRRIAKYLPMDVQKAAYIADSYNTGVSSHMEEGAVVFDNNDAIDADYSEGQAEQIEQETGGSKTLDSFADASSEEESPSHDPETGEVTDDPKDKPISGTQHEVDEAAEQEAKEKADEIYKKAYVKIPSPDGTTEADMEQAWSLYIEGFIGQLEEIGTDYAKGKAAALKEIFDGCLREVRGEA